MKLHDVAPGRGFLWVRGAFSVLLRQPLGYAGLFTSCFFVLMLVGMVPIAGLMMFAAMPVAALLFMIATRRVLGGLTVFPGTFAELKGAGRERLLGLLKLGLACGAAMLAILWLGDVVDGGALESLHQYAGSTDEMARHVADPALQKGVLTRLGLMALLAIPAWHAPALVFWGRQSWARALFFSSYACWRNKGAFIVYAFGWFSVWLLMATLIGVMLSLFQSTLMVVVIVPLTLAFWTAIGASLYFTFADCFEPEPPGAPPSAP
ncbi:MAG: hypothetical protein M3Z29_10250 [Pseudomonadota bacterium]|nr:hypothetical protein [Pseudomonadota bacterium]